MFRTAGITVQSQKTNILACAEREFRTINESMGKGIVYPHQNLPMYLDVLRAYMHTPPLETETYERNTISARQEHTPVIDLNIEAARGQVSAPRQIGEA